MKRRYVLPITILIAVILLIAALAIIAGGSSSTAFTVFKPSVPTRTPTSPADALLRQVFQMHPGIKHIDDANAGQVLNLSQTLNGYTITLHRVYADANQTVVAYTVTSALDKNVLNFTRLRLAEDSNTEFKHERTTDSKDKSTMSGHVYSFYTPLSDTIPSKLDLHLTVNLGNWNGAAGDIAGPFNFEFSTAVETKGTLISEVGQTIEASGIAMTLDKVIVTPGTTRALLLCKRVGEGKVAVLYPRACLVPKADLAVDDWTSMPEKYPSEASDYTQLLGNRGWVYAYRFNKTPQSWRGEWTLTVTELFDDFVGGRMPFPSIPGPWVFKFNMPHPQE